MNGGIKMYKKVYAVVVVEDVNYGDYFESDAVIKMVTESLDRAKAFQKDRQSWGYSSWVTLNKIAVAVGGGRFSLFSPSKLDDKDINVHPVGVMLDIDGFPYELHVTDGILDSIALDEINRYGKEMAVWQYLKEE